ncbi:hypothetical protein H206_00965 [Candidatus Electrothrix aarhusensis]|uniref:Uncharacterized protein n=1 Tax=Candidatus Electrothrix aarhusensis TaxID=1859131 RepID=A0A444IWV3_9BACT|nr:hypothetical protein H206_00965 [Candidatus Electrothrix aarhusensis]
MDKIIELVKELAKLKTANPKEIADSISMDISNGDLDKLIEELYSMGWVESLHRQTRSGKSPEYNQITITKEGIYAAENPPTE